MAKSLEKEFRYYLKHQNELVAKYNGKFVVIIGEEVVGTFDSEIKAIEETSKSHAMGTFLVQKCESGSEGHTQTYHSRVAFA